MKDLFLTGIEQSAFGSCRSVPWYSLRGTSDRRVALQIAGATNSLDRRETGGLIWLRLPSTPTRLEQQHGRSIRDAKGQISATPAYVTSPQQSKRRLSLPQLIYTWKW